MSSSGSSQSSPGPLQPKVLDDGGAHLQGPVLDDGGAHLLVRREELPRELEALVQLLQVLDFRICVLFVRALFLDLLDLLVAQRVHQRPLHGARSARPWPSLLAPRAPPFVTCQARTRQWPSRRAHGICLSAGRLAVPCRSAVCGGTAGIHPCIRARRGLTD